MSTPTNVERGASGPVERAVADVEQALTKLGLALASEQAPHVLLRPLAPFKALAAEVVPLVLDEMRKRL